MRGTLAARIACVALAACALQPPRHLMPDALAVRDGERMVAALAARGVQVYECRGTGWALVAPDADLFEDDGRPAGHHGAGPHWVAPDGSRVEATVLARVEAPAPGTIPWLLLEARSTGGPGRFAGVTRIRRVATTGGLAPAKGCDGARLGAQARVPYTADYLFYAAR